ncbi:alpha/beta hydrolase [Sulfurihydrogenibium azorense]|uniref:Putative carboxylesterase n=1 Tax=Sulfurihydrogenibium azorense (strain DSM 15241 / OCM 825 / Az-Fu1) TaxID=204536 RepID=C1DUD5_SULAA|nr:alpha/beta fold hydrolase [Sulfurihydrogenibium azorense]ACN98727.1 putative carboxylesterase [Sulfurihydrogenibium azorense Az-Fu1]
MSYKDGFILKGEGKKALILLHGLTGSPFELRWIGGKFNQEGYDVYCPILPGHCTTVKDLEKTKWKDWLEAPRTLLKTIEKDYDEIYLAGLCVGGMLALLLSRESDKVKAVASWSPLVYLDGWTIPKAVVFLPLVLSTPLKHIFYFKEKYPYGIKNDKVRKKVLSLAEKTSFVYDRFTGIVLKELLDLSKYFVKQLPYIKKPTIIIHSKYDDVSSVKSAYTIYEKISSQKKKLIIVEDSYHMITIDNDKETVFEQTLKFFQ